MEMRIRSKEGYLLKNWTWSMLGKSWKWSTFRKNWVGLHVVSFLKMSEGRCTMSGETSPSKEGVGDQTVSRRHQLTINHNCRPPREDMSYCDGEIGCIH